MIEKQFGAKNHWHPGHMGQFLQDGKNEQTLSKKISFGASL